MPLKKKIKVIKRPLGELLVGEALVVETENELVPWIISAPTMRVPMRLRQTVNPYLAMKAEGCARCGIESCSGTEN